MSGDAMTVRPRKEGDLVPVASMTGGGMTNLKRRKREQSEILQLWIFLTEG